MSNESKQPWVLTGYEIFSQEGPKGLKIEVIARRVGKSKSSFYHHFADLEVFTGILLSYHIKRVTIIADKERRCQNVIPDLLHLLISVKQDLLFNRQLRIHRNIAEFRHCFEISGKLSGEAILGIWAETLGLTNNSNLAQIVLNLSLENFYLQITEETLNYPWLENYVNELKMMVRAFQINPIK